MEEQSEGKTLYNRLRENVLPLKEGDSPVIKLGKNVGFSLFLILFTCVSLTIVIAISLAL
ncbi:MAG: hypothetical protein J0I41_03375 [Filimonas sp.]|nr:hypothetical protein [Filimonas sp.]